MKILITGSGGREHALAWRAAQSDAVTDVFVAPGNAGTAADDKLTNVAIDVMDFAAQMEFVRANAIDLTIIGPEAPLVAGVVDQFKAAGLKCFGPERFQAQLEGSKSFTKAFLARHDIPTAAYGSFDDPVAAVAFLQQMSIPVVIKADGLAAGKGVVIAQSQAEAEATIRDMLSGNAFGAAGARVVIEEFLVGEEASFIVMADGQHFLPFATSQDHKAAFDGDAGPNTGGMGAYSPAPVVTPAVYQKIIDQVIQPTLEGMASDGYPYTGFLYAGLMIDAAGNPRVIEFNCRFGDPETQPVMMRMRSDLALLCLAAIAGELASHSIVFDDQVALTVVMAAGGYPNDYASGAAISGIDDADALGANTMGKVFHGGTRLNDGQVETSGGRVLGVTAMGDSVQQAQFQAYAMVKKIQFDKAQYRSDIGYRAIARELSD
ncbi:MAG: phosphoribosylamine--glycine ligase [Candidatus Azotimanducaceae bacterium]|jgi:phosphoribosylamine--glycine ligase